MEVAGRNDTSVRQLLEFFLNLVKKLTKSLLATVKRIFG